MCYSCMFILLFFLQFVTCLFAFLQLKTEHFRNIFDTFLTFLNEGWNVYSSSRNFELPWLDDRSRCRIEVPKKHTPHRTCRKWNSAELLLDARIRKRVLSEEGGKKTSQVIMYNCCCFQVCVRVNDSPASTSHHRPADLLQNIVKPAPFWVSLICLVSLTLPKGRLNAWCHKITVPMLSDVEDYTSVSKSKCYVHVL